MFNLALNFIPVFIFLIADSGSAHWSWLEMPILIAALAVLAAGIGMLLSALFVRYRDIEPIWDVVLQVLFYATPIFYTVQLVIDRAGQGWATAIMCNPFA